MVDSDLVGFGWDEFGFGLVGQGWSGLCHDSSDIWSNKRASGPRTQAGNLPFRVVGLTLHADGWDQSDLSGKSDNSGREQLLQ
jgi:hypothetical protein